jgi:polyferredoxin
VQIIVTIFVSVVIVFLASIIFRKRAFCSTLCPFGALPPMIHKISPYKMKIDQDKCVKCDLCFKECPSFAIDRTDNVYSITRYCNLCYRCVRECKYDAITTNRLTPFISLLIGGALSLFYVPSAIRHLLQLMGV